MRRLTLSALALIATLCTSTAQDSPQAKSAPCDKLPYRLGHLASLHSTPLWDYPRQITKKEWKELSRKQGRVDRECNAFVRTSPGQPVAKDVAWTVEGFAAYYARCESFCGTERDLSELTRKEVEARTPPK